MGEVVAVVVCYNSSEVLQGLLDSLHRFEPTLRSIVVDNASPDGVPDADGAELVVADENRGFGAGCNIGVETLRGSPPEFVVFLNPDVRLQGSSISELAAQMASKSSAGVATGRIVDSHGRRVPGAWGEASTLRLVWSLLRLKMIWLRRIVGRFGSGGVLTSSRSMVEDCFRVDGFILGGVMMVRWSCFEQIGGFDERFFMTWEDADLCRRARDEGWEIWQLPTTPFVHLGTRSSRGVSERQWRTWYREGARRYGETHLSPRRRRMFRAITRSLDS